MEMLRNSDHARMPPNTWILILAYSVFISITGMSYYALVEGNFNILIIAHNFYEG